MDLYNQLQSNESYTYKLLQLPNELLENVQKGTINQLQIKSNHTSVVICDESSTWKLRQMNHSNTVLLMNQKENDLIGFQTCNYEYELSSMEGSINVSNIPLYNGSINSSSSITLIELMNNSLCSTNEFLNLWYNYNGVEVDGKCYILSPDLITDLLSSMIIKLISLQKIDDGFSITDVESVYLNNPPFNKSMMTTILHKFTTNDEGRYHLSNDTIANWYGLVELKKVNYKPMLKNEFLLNWKSSLPPYYSPSLDIINLSGHYTTVNLNHLIYINPTDLSTNLPTRFKELFGFNKNWAYDEFIPFIQSFVPKGKKVDSLIIKYARKKKIDSEYIVCPR